MKNITLKQELLIIDFIKTAKLNNAGFICAALPINHPTLKSGSGVQMKQIRKVKEYLAYYCDELGNLVYLSVSGFVVQS